MKPLLISTGRAADWKDKYFERKKIENKIWAKINKTINFFTLPFSAYPVRGRFLIVKTQKKKKDYSKKLKAPVV